MTKDELIEMKKKLETKVRIVDDSSFSGILTQYEVEQGVDTKGAVDNVEKYFESVLKYYTEKGMAYDEIYLVPGYSLIVKEEEFEDHTIKKGAKALPHLAAVRINMFHCMDGNRDMCEDPDNIYDNNFEQYIVVLEDFINLIKQRGFEYSGISTIEEIQDVITSANCPIAKISLCFDKKLGKTKINK